MGRGSPGGCGAGIGSGDGDGGSGIGSGGIPGSGGWGTGGSGTEKDVVCMEPLMEKVVRGSSVTRMHSAETRSGG